VKICSERRLLECSNWLTRQIFIRKINIREEICYCLLESGLQKFNVSEQFYPSSSRGTVVHHSSSGEEEGPVLGERYRPCENSKRWEKRVSWHVVQVIISWIPEAVYS
jgi:hypothetical protein